MTMANDDSMYSVLCALAEALIPVADTTAWAGEFLRARLHAHPEDDERFQQLADHVDRLAREARNEGFAQLSVADREALLRVHHPTLAGSPADSDEQRALRRTMQDIIVGFFTADELDFSADPYALRGDLVPRDRNMATTLEYSTADRVPDVAIDRRTATWVGIGTYARAWRAAGYPNPPGVAPEHPEDITLEPGLVALRKRR